MIDALSVSERCESRLNAASPAGVHMWERTGGIFC
jgi:hypothetical protein